MGRLTQRQLKPLCLAFTLVEILVAVAILGLVASIGLVSLVQYGQRQEFGQVVYEVHSGLRDAQSKSRASLGDTTHGVYIGTSTLQYFSGSAAVPGNPTDPAVPIPAGISVTPNLSGGGSEVVFARVTGIPTVTGTIVVTDTRSFATATITVSASGLVQ